MTRAANTMRPGTMSLGDHLEELRRCIIHSVLPIIPISIITFLISDRLIEWFLSPLHAVLARHGLPTQVQALSPPEVIVAKIKVSLIVAAVLCAPWLVWQAWRFVRPGLHRHEQRFVHFLLPGSAILTITGLALLQYVMLPLILEVLILFGTTLEAPAVIGAAGPDQGAVQVVSILEEPPASPQPGELWILMPQQVLEIAVPAGTDTSEVRILRVTLQGGSLVQQIYRLSWYINFVLLLMLGISIAFHMPLVILLLGWLDLASAAWFRKHRKYALLVCAVLSAMITPPEAVSMLAMLLPLYLLYELGIILLVVAPASRIAGPIDLDDEGRPHAPDDIVEHENRDDEP